MSELMAFVARSLHCTDLINCLMTGRFVLMVQDLIGFLAHILPIGDFLEFTNT